MIKCIMMSVVCIPICLVSSAQVTNYNVVFDMTSKDTINQQSLVRQLSLISQSNPTAKLEVVIYGHGLEFVIKNKSNQPEAVSKLLTAKNISIKVCAFTMKRQQVEKEQLIPGVQIVPDGIYEIVQRQQQGWGYIKVAH